MHLFMHKLVEENLVCAFSLRAVDISILQIGNWVILGIGVVVHSIL